MVVGCCSVAVASGGVAGSGSGAGAVSVGGGEPGEFDRRSVDGWSLSLAATHAAASPPPTTRTVAAAIKIAFLRIAGEASRRTGSLTKS